MPADTLLDSPARRPDATARPSAGGRHHEADQTRPMITRVWHGWTTSEKADACEQVLRQELQDLLRDGATHGCVSADLLRRDLGPGEVEFVTILKFASWDAVRRFAGENFARAVVSDEARRMLSRFYEVARHYEAR